jgi:hypothetical protein
MSQMWVERTTGTACHAARSLVIQQATEPWAPMNRAGAPTMREPLDEPILETLMIPLAMVVIDEFLEGPSEMALTEWHDFDRGTRV